MNFFKTQTAELRTVWQVGYGPEVKRTAIAFVILVVFSFGLSLALPNLRDTVMGYVMNLFGGMDVLDENGRISALFLFSNNLQACVSVMLWGLLPFLRFPALSLGTNAMLLGVLAAHYAANGLSLAVYFAALLPHAIFELPALVLAIAMGLFVCGQLSRRCRRDETAIPLWDCFTHISRLLLVALVPLLAAAALMEAYVTPWIVSFFQ
ncbi:MAG: stage II sporulation protein M [Oscillibacter sp.]